MPLAYANPRELGVDRWLNAVAAYHQHRQAVIVVDMGTATNFECVSATGEFLGGAICIGPQLSLDALCQRSTKLPHVQLTASAHVLADNSRAALLSGAYHGHAAMIDGMVARLSAEMSTPVTVVGTGGYSALFAPVCRSLNVVEPDLTLHGVRLVWEHHREQTRTTT
jgi:type III pantothenate kinase